MVKLATRHGHEEPFAEVFQRLGIVWIEFVFARKLLEVRRRIGASGL
jgi:hypothetical protein